MLLERTLMSTALCGMLTVHERVILLAILVSVRECNLDIFAFKVYYGVKPVVGHIVGEQVFQSVAALNPAPVIHYDKSRVQISVVAEHCLHEIIVEMIVLEQLRVWFKEDVRAVLILCFLCTVVLKFTLLEHHRAHFAVSITACLEVST